jgi:hypothetical protein
MEAVVEVEVMVVEPLVVELPQVLSIGEVMGEMV